MSPPKTKKRGAEQSDTVTPAKRATARKLGEPEVIELEEDETYHIAVRLHSKFDVYPPLLRKTLESSFGSTVQAQVKAMSDKTLPKDKYSFAIVTERRVRQAMPNAASNRTNLKLDIPSLSLANTALLELFSRNHKKYLEKPSFVQLKTEEGIANPEFIYHHAVRLNEIGWAFDTNGCLSLDLVYKENAKVNDYAIYVERTEVKVEKEDEA